MFLLKKDDLHQVLESWAKELQVYAPAQEDGNTLLLPYDKEKFNLEYINFSLPVKEYIYEQKEELFTWEKEGNEIKTKTPTAADIDSKVLFGVRACDAYGIAYMDKFFLQEFKDNNYAIRREKAYIVALNCLKPGAGCFCTSTETGPFAENGFDLLFTPLKNDYLVEVGSPKGEKLLSLAPGYFLSTEDNFEEEKAKLKHECEFQFTRKLDTSILDTALKAKREDPLWDILAKKCIKCTGCTNVCPTCTCFNVVEENKSKCSGCRVRYWDSCQADSFTRNAGNHNPRTKTAQVRYRMYDKLKYSKDRFDMKGCTGCGRCTDACPVFIDIVDTANTIVAKYKADLDQSKIIEETDRYEKGGEHVSCEHLYTPQIAIIKDIVQETRDIKRFILEYEDKSLHENFKFSGQFFEITVFGVGEIAISIPFSDKQNDFFDFCVKKAGKVTSALHDLQVGDKVGLRGPFGNGFPFEDIKGRDLLIVGSGVGLAPVRTVIVRALENRQDFGKIVVIASATSYNGLVYKEDLLEWPKIEGVRVLYALSKPTDAVDAHVGYINDLLPDLGLDWENTTSILCASPRRIKAVAKDLLALGMKGTDILTSLETHMRCGIGKCGHCKVGSKYMCVDGPVFNYEEMLTLPPEF